MLLREGEFSLELEFPLSSLWENSLDVVGRSIFLTAAGVILGKDKQANLGSKPTGLKVAPAQNYYRQRATIGNRTEFMNGISVLTPAVLGASASHTRSTIQTLFGPVYLETSSRAPASGPCEPLPTSEKACRQMA